MKTISIRLEDDIYEELGNILDEMGQTKQTFYETYTKTVVRERCIPFIIKAPVNNKTNTDNKLSAFERLEEIRKNTNEEIDYDIEREIGMNEKYGVID